MSIINRIKSTFKTKINTKLDEIEDMKETLKISNVEISEDIYKVKKSKIELTTLKMRLENELCDLEGKIEIAEEQAELSIASRWDDLAEAALSKKRNLLEKKMKIYYEINEVEKMITGIKN